MNHKDVQCVCYVDDLAMVVLGRTERDIMYKGNRALRDINEWTKLHGLQLEPTKTQAIILKLRRRLKEINYTMEDITVVPEKKTVKYLGVVFDSNMIFGKHIKSCCKKAENTVAALRKIMPRVGGPKEKKRRILAYITSSIPTYACPVWGDAVHIKKYRNMLRAVQRRVAIAVSRRYRTISTEASLVISGIIPIDLLIEKQDRPYHSQDRGTNAKIRRKINREITLTKWQDQWTNVTRVEWTNKLIPYAKEWYNRKHGLLNYNLTQVLSGHGNFCKYLAKKRSNSTCRYCTSEEDAEHAIFKCPKWNEPRTYVEQEIGKPLNVSVIIQEMLDSEAK